MTMLGIDAQSAMLSYLVIVLDLNIAFGPTAAVTVRKAKLFNLEELHMATAPVMGKLLLSSSRVPWPCVCSMHTA